MAVLVEMIALTLDRDLAAHLAVALRSHRKRLVGLGHAEPEGLAQLEAMAVSIVNRHQEASVSANIPGALESDPDDRKYLTRAEISRAAHVSLSTVDRWIAGGGLPSSLHGRTRRVARDDLDCFLRKAA